MRVCGLAQLGPPPSRQRGARPRRARLGAKAAAAAVIVRVSPCQVPSLPQPLRFVKLEGAATPPTNPGLRVRRARHHGGARRSGDCRSGRPRRQRPAAGRAAGRDRPRGAKTCRLPLAQCAWSLPARLPVQGDPAVRKLALRRTAPQPGSVSPKRPQAPRARPKPLNPPSGRLAPSCAGPTPGCPTLRLPTPPCASATTPAASSLQQTRTPGGTSSRVRSGPARARPSRRCKVTRAAARRALGRRSVVLACPGACASAWVAVGAWACPGLF
jgi:hypothetical protein